MASAQVVAAPLQECQESDARMTKLASVRPFGQRLEDINCRFCRGGAVCGIGDVRSDKGANVLYL
jgi:hypothetical protein